MMRVIDRVKVNRIERMPVLPFPNSDYHTGLIVLISDNATAPMAKGKGKSKWNMAGLKNPGYC